MSAKLERLKAYRKEVTKLIRLMRKCDKYEGAGCFHKRANAAHLAYRKQVEIVDDFEL